MNSRTFGIIFATAIVFTILSGAMAFYIAGQNNPTAEFTELFGVCLKTWVAGTLAIFGLLTL